MGATLEGKVVVVLNTWIEKENNMETNLMQDKPKWSREGKKAHIEANNTDDHF